jgi:hypothetical protein
MRVGGRLFEGRIHAGDLHTDGAEHAGQGGIIADAVML